MESKIAYLIGYEITSQVRSEDAIYACAPCLHFVIDNFYDFDNNGAYLSIILHIEQAYSHPLYSKMKSTL